MNRLDRWLAVLVVGLATLASGCGHDTHYHVGFHNPGGGGGGGGGVVAVTFTDFQDAVRVVGQVSFAGQMPNQGGAPGPHTLDLPTGRAAEGSLLVPDRLSNRGLGFDNTPNVNGGAADFALGQPDLVTTTAGVTPNKMNGPTDVWIAGSTLVVADRGNNRVLIWNPQPNSSGAPPTHVVGQVDFVSNGAATTQTGLSAPSSACIAGGRLFVADTANNRVLIWNSVPNVDGAPADVVLGQAGFGTAAAGLSPTELNGPTCVWSDGTRLAVADAGNHRVLIWRPLPTLNAEPADVVVGQPDFVTGAAGAGAQGLSGPTSVGGTSAQLIVADTGNNRVLDYVPFPSTNHPMAAAVLGQGGFVNTTPDDDDQNGVADANPTARTLDMPTGVLLRGKRLFVTDSGNHRVLIFEGN